MAVEVNSVPLSLTIMPSRPRRWISRQIPRHAPPRDRSVGDRRQTLPGDVVDHIEDAEPTTTGELVMHEVQDRRALTLASTRIGARVPTARRRMRPFRTLRAHPESC
jgi:hypothetical protein